MLIRLAGLCSVYVKSHSTPERGEGSIYALMKTKMSSLPAVLVQFCRQGNAQQQESFTERNMAAACDR